MYVNFPQRPNGLRGVDGACCSSCATTGGSCSDDHATPRNLAPPQVEQGPWMGGRLMYDERYVDYRLPQAGTLPSIDGRTEDWQDELADKGVLWRG